MDRIPGLHLRVQQNHEEVGLDVTQMGELAYTFMVSSPLVGFGDSEGSSEKIVVESSDSTDTQIGESRIQWGGAQTVESISEV